MRGNRTTVLVVQQAALMRHGRRHYSEGSSRWSRSERSRAGSTGGKARQRPSRVATGTGRRGNGRNSATESAIARHRQHFAALDPFKHFAALITHVSYGYLDHAGKCITGETRATSAGSGARRKHADTGGQDSIRTRLPNLAFSFRSALTRGTSRYSASATNSQS